MRVRVRYNHFIPLNMFENPRRGTTKGFEINIIILQNKFNILKINKEHAVHIRTKHVYNKSEHIAVLLT